MNGSKLTGKGLVFNPVPPGDNGRLDLPISTVKVDVEESELEIIYKGLENGAFTTDDLVAVLEESKTKYDVNPIELTSKLFNSCKPADASKQFGDINISHHLEHMSLVAIKLIDRAQKYLLDIKPLHEIRFDFTDEAKIALRIGWEAMAKHGRFPLPPKGPARLNKLEQVPTGMMHFVSASDSDQGYYYTMGIALSPEAQSIGDIDLSYGLDGELIVPGQAVAPIPPTLAMSTRLFAASIPTSSNISEDIQSIPYSSFAHPEIMDVAPMRGFLFRPKYESKHDQIEHVIEELSEQLDKYKAFVKSTTEEERAFLPDVGGAIDISNVKEEEMISFVKTILQNFSEEDKKVISLFLVLDSKINTTQGKYSIEMNPRVEKTCKAIKAASVLGLKYVSVCDQDEDEWMPNLLEYFTAAELTYLADYSDERSVILCDGRPVDPVYTASTAALRIQSVFTTLSVDILKMGMWLCLDALSARRVWKELQNNPHIPERMFLMPIGIIEPYSAFVDNRDKSKTPRPILDPFDKIKFMIEEAKILGAPSLLTDTRHKSKWVLLGSVDNDMKPHIRESIGAIPLIGFKKFMECERLAREAGIILGQAGSIETDQIFSIMSETIRDAAHDGKNPATAIWTAETERVLRRRDGSTLRADLQSQRRASIVPYLSVTNRAMESHAKLNGWLEFLETLGKGNEKLRSLLLEKRELLVVLQEALLEAQSKLGSNSNTPDGLKTYKSAWLEFQYSFRSYHELIKSNFKSIRDKVAEVWNAQKLEKDESPEMVMESINV